MTDRIPVGVVGLGTIAQVAHLPALARLPDRYEVSHVCDLAIDVAAHVAESIEGRVRISTDLDEMATDSELRAVIVLTPGAHGEEVLRAVRTGKHVLAEKPLCLSSDELAAIHEAAKDNDVVVQVGYMKAHDPAFNWLRHQIPELGRIRLVAIEVLHPPEATQLTEVVFRGPAPCPASVGFEPTSSPSVLADEPRWLQWFHHEVALGSLVHQVSAARVLVGQGWHGLEVFDLSPSDWALHQDLEPPSLSVAGLTDDGGSVRLEWLWMPDLPFYRETLTIVGDVGSAVLDLPSAYDPEARGSAIVRTASGVNRYEPDGDPPAFVRQLSAFHDNITGGFRGVVDVEGIVRDMETLVELTRSVGHRSQVNRDPAGATVRVSDER